VTCVVLREYNLYKELEGPFRRMPPVFCYGQHKLAFEKKKVKALRLGVDL
jgi:hypothetical protein